MLAGAGSGNTNTSLRPSFFLSSSVSFVSRYRWFCAGCSAERAAQLTEEAQIKQCYHTHITTVKDPPPASDADLLLLCAHGTTATVDVWQVILLTMIRS
jgi:hypothetical protein